MPIALPYPAPLITRINMDKHSFHARPMPAAMPLPKRRRTILSDVEMTDVQTLRLQSLPHEALKQILHHLQPSPATPDSLRTYYSLRTLCVALRDAFDAQVTCIHLSNANPFFISNVLPRFRYLSRLSIPVAAAQARLIPEYDLFFRRSGTRIQSIVYTSDGSDGALPALVANAIAKTVESVSTTCAPLLQALAAHAPPIHTLELLMNEMDPRLFTSFACLSHVRLLYRDTGMFAGMQLVSSLRQCRNLQTVELRVHGVSTREVEFLGEVPRLRKLSLFGCVVEGEKRIDAVGQCHELEELQLEWMHGLNGMDMRVVARGLGGRLRQLRIWNCEEVDDAGLEAVARWCGMVEVEVRFVREQFSARVLSLFGERISWGSYAM
eukprot:GFKZ01001252.1.p1 GENE.GFKZ01001252.1~~GFKZ01001252.1.p1  ORF type:complete len:381 (-),score=15.90 GFKZ01001252.1:84-1226(-)